MVFTRPAKTKRSASTFALAIALATGGVLTATAIEAPAQAQKKKKKDSEEESPKYSKDFVAVYTPANDAMSAEGADLAAVAAMISGVEAAIETPGDRQAAGNLIYNLGQKQSDMAMQLRGVELMVESGLTPPERLGTFNFLAGQLAYQMDDFTKARTYLSRAVDAGYTENDPQALIAESYFAEDNYADGLRVLGEAIDAQKAAGQRVDEQWLKRGLAMAYNNNVSTEAQRYALLYVTEYPSDVSWGDAIAVTLNTNRYENPEVLDIMRLARRTNTFRDSNMILEYIEAADPRRLPGEVVAVIDAGIASGLLDSSDTFVSESRKQAAGRVDVDKTDLPDLASDARASGAALNTVMAAANTFLSYGRGAEAEEFFNKALTMPGANTPMVLTRLGMAQVEQGKFTEAQETFRKVEGARQAIANLWAIYSTQQAGG